MHHASEELIEKMTAKRSKLQLILHPKACTVCDPSILNSPLDPLSVVKGGQDSGINKEFGTLSSLGCVVSLSAKWQFAPHEQEVRDLTWFSR